MSHSPPPAAAVPSRFCPHALQLSPSCALPHPTAPPAPEGHTANAGMHCSHTDLCIHCTSLASPTLHPADMSTCGTGYSSGSGSSSGYSAPSSPGYGRRLQDGYGSSGSSGYGSSGSSGYGGMKKAQVCTVGGADGLGF